ncbi:hypothetical protein QC04_000826 [Salmonella enterica subsp. enterica]|nr:hypothetical protein [Salmonella enterica subsp. enterica serovar Poona]EHA9057672.1 hypothetical protein [Salmonella enterica subsp. enterica serovar Poona]EIC0973475.1 hypothetical protein [Salmonella enterica subsp. enterica serovar Poona]
MSDTHTRAIHAAKAVDARTVRQLMASIDLAVEAGMSADAFRRSRCIVRWLK